MDENDTIISQFIDDELELDEKITFVEKVHGSSAFTEETLSLLNQEKLIRTDVEDAKPVRKPSFQVRRTFPLLRPVNVAVAALAAAVIVLSTALFLEPGQDRQEVKLPGMIPYRFVIYEPGVRKVEIAGSFTGWKKVPLELRNRSGYWEVTLDLSPGEHSFSYILNGSRKIADPTVPASEPDDFGGKNSILYTEVHT
jgi:hypothetical protein